MDIDLIKKQLAEAAEKGYAKIKGEIGAAIKECREDTLVDLAAKLVAATDVRAVLTGPISDELASQINMYDDPYPLLCDRLYMSREYCLSLYFNALEGEIDSIIDPTSDLEDSPELLNEESFRQMTGQSM